MFFKKKIIHSLYFLNIFLLILYNITSNINIIPCQFLLPVFMFVINFFMIIFLVYYLFKKLIKTKEAHLVFLENIVVGILSIVFILKDVFFIQIDLNIIKFIYFIILIITFYISVNIRKIFDN